VIDAKLSSVQLAIFKKTNHTTFISFCGVSLGKASPLLNVQTFFFITICYALDSIYHLSLIEERELVDWEQSWDVLNKIGKIGMRMMLQTLGLLQPELVNRSLDDHKECCQGHKNRQNYFDFLGRHSSFVLTDYFAIVSKLLQIAFLVGEKLRVRR
jgi:hypothetical protein